MLISVLASVKSLSGVRNLSQMSFYLKKELVTPSRVGHMKRLLIILAAAILTLVFCITGMLLFLILEKSCL